MPSQIPDKKAAPNRAAAKPVKKSATAAALGSANKAASVSEKPESIKKPVDRTDNPQHAVLSQEALFEKAMDLFHARDFAAAVQTFEEAASGNSAEIAHAARMRINMCHQRLSMELPIAAATTAEEHYNVAIALINQRELKKSRAHLNCALELTPNDDHLYYALALVMGLEGDYPASARALARAIELHPQNKSAARNDPDFHEILRHVELRAILETQEAASA